MTMPLAPAVLDAVAAWLPQARWCADKDRLARGLHVADAIPLPGIGVLLLVDVAAARALYAVPVALTGADAALTPAFARWMLDTVFAGASVAGASGRVEGRVVGAVASVPAGMPDVSLMGADASNTSCRVRLGETVYATKLIRRCRAGVQPEVEVGAFLAEQTSWRGTPRLLGHIDYRPADGGPATTLATVHAFAAGCAGAWDVLLALVRDGGLDGPHGPRVLAIVDAVAAVTAEMHASLASRADVPAFAPEVPTAAARRSFAEGLVSHADEVCRQIAAYAADADTPLADRLRAVAGCAANLRSRLMAVAEIDAGAAWIRVHGDYHLGQVLLDDHDRPLVIDFEGEPGRSLEERRAKTTACKDVAGMCRSFDYLLRCAARDGGPAYRADESRGLQRRFVEGYARRVAGQEWWPARPSDAEALLAASMLDKAVYELAYEIRNRPDWIEVPLAAVEALLYPPA
jgi:maltose alpha-D-glucosyltransferase/alpha-amylase